MKQVLFGDDVQFWFETVRLFGQTSYGCAEFGEVLAAASQITAGDYDSWYDAYSGLAGRLWDEAGSARPVTARDLYLRASTYYFTAPFFLHGNPDDPRINAAYDRSVEAFRRTLPQFSHTITPVGIPYEGTVLDGYFYRSDVPGPRPTLIMHSGFDGCAEELHGDGAWAGVERGYHVLTFDGPGQPSALRRGLHFRPDWEVPVGVVLDFLAGDKGVDQERIALAGVSLGGMLAPRAAAFEPRIAALVALDGVYDASAAAFAQLPLPRDAVERWARGADDPAVERVMTGARTASPVMRWATDHGRYAFGVDTDREFLARYLDYTLAGGVAERITCPTLVCEAADDVFFGEGGEQSEPRRLFAHLTCPKTLLSFTAAEGADAHCQAGAQRLAVGRIFDWLDATLRAGAARGARSSGCPQ